MDHERASLARLLNQAISIHESVWFMLPFRWSLFSRHGKMMSAAMPYNTIVIPFCDWKESTLFSAWCHRGLFIYTSSQTNGYMVKRLTRLYHWKLAAGFGNEIRTVSVSVRHGEGDKVSKAYVLVCYSLIPDSWSKKPLAGGSRFLASLVRDQRVTHQNICFTI